MSFILAGTLLSLALYGCLTSRQSHHAGETRFGPRHLQQYVWVPPGSFEMGCSDGDAQCDPIEKPARNVVVAKAFWIGQTEVTTVAYKHFVQTTGGKMPPEPEWQGRSFNPPWQDLEQPIVNVTWYDAQAFCGWIGGRLPTASEWEYAARAGNTSSRYGDIGSVAWYSDNSGNLPFNGEAIIKSNPNDFGRLLFKSGAHPHPVAQKAPNYWGLYDTLGNVWEWTSTPFPKQRQPGENKSASTATQILRGGAWSFTARFSRVSAKGSAPRLHRSTGIGFRCVLDNPAAGS